MPSEDVGMAPSGEYFEYEPKHPLRMRNEL